MGAGGRGGAPGCFVPHAVSEWRFDDCNTRRTDLVDVRGNHTAYRSVSTACGEGVDGQSVSFDGKEDLVYIPDQPDFTFADGVTVAAWANPSDLGGARTIARKREQGSSSFVLLTNGRKYQFIVQIGRRSAISVAAPAKKDVWTHVAGNYDGRIARLYLDGQEVAITAAMGRIVDGAGPLLLGNDGDNRRFEGRLDGVFFTTQALAPRDVLALTCRRGPLAVAVEPAVSAASAPGTAVKFDIAITNETVNGFVIRARPAMDQLVLSAFPRTPEGKLDLDRAPMTLLAIVNRFDLRNAAKGHAGEGRFIFGVTPFGSPLEFTIILEYTLPASNLDEVQAWADRWHALGALPFPVRGVQRRPAGHHGPLHAPGGGCRATRTAAPSTSSARTRSLCRSSGSCASSCVLRPAGWFRRR